MRIRSTADLAIASSDRPLPTVEVDLDSLPGDESFPAILAEALSNYAEGDPVVATIYTYFGTSANFHQPTSSAFILVAGKERILNHIKEAFARIAGVRVRFSDYVASYQAQVQAHLEDGVLWRPLDAENWYSEVERLIADDSNIEEEVENEMDDDLTFDEALEFDDSEVVEAEVTRKSTPRRTRAARSDASVGSIIRSIERIFSLPEGSVVLCGPDKRALRRDARIGTLRRRWED